MIEELVKKTRSYRRFYEEHRIDMDQLLKLIDLARLSASSANLQPLKYIPVNDPDICNNIIFPRLKWAGYLKDWDGPSPGERPSAYIIVLGDTTISRNFGCDHGISSQNILLGATEMGFGACIIGSVEREKVKNDLNIPGHLRILHVIALGKPKEKVVIEQVGPDGDIRYWRDKNGVHHVPKRSLKEIVINPLLS